jgi:hypothetical protein
MQLVKRSFLDVDSRMQEPVQDRQVAAPIFAPEPVQNKQLNLKTVAMQKNTDMAKKQGILKKAVRGVVSVTTVPQRAVGSLVSGKKPTLIVKKGDTKQAVKDFGKGAATVGVLVGGSVAGKQLVSKAKQSKAGQVADKVKKGAGKPKQIPSAAQTSAGQTKQASTPAMTKNQKIGLGLGLGFLFLFSFFGKQIKKLFK